MSTIQGMDPEDDGYSCDSTRKQILERETGFEPATSTLARSHSTTELLPLDDAIINYSDSPIPSVEQEQRACPSIQTACSQATRRDNFYVGKAECYFLK